MYTVRSPCFLGKGVYVKTEKHRSRTLYGWPRAHKIRKTNLYSDSNGTRINCFFFLFFFVSLAKRSRELVGIRTESNLVYGTARCVPVSLARLLF